ncbi:hypothetical protein PVAP13_7KG023309 [Panicum virgatum]|uniref:Uncharacterized protein n=1 Tax=Panicum virgatum TaxID=38727 RepID=A0A8T0QBZ9_PANVG|nr:hypothetical protein PVAP13_7KG023300 [Panicum virgatum]KAG2570112.1 hypothetical protein PVAP13_7KG023309 [Panicum virgatum]
MKRTGLPCRCSSPDRRTTNGKPSPEVAYGGGQIMHREQDRVQASSAGARARGAGPHGPKAARRRSLPHCCRAGSTEY